MPDAIDELILREGGFVNDPADRGGPTKYGITQERLSQWRGIIATAEDVANLTKEEARAIYEAIYAAPLERIAAFPDLYRLVLDVSVLSGPTTAVRLLQMALNHLGGSPSLTVDGVLGPHTADAVASVPTPALVQALVAARIPALVRIVEGDPTQLRFLEGWVVRTLGFLPKLA